MYWLNRIDNGPRRVNHASVELNGLIYSFGGFSNTEHYTRTTPIDINIFRTDILKWYKLPNPTIDDHQHDSIPFSRYGHTVVAYQKTFYVWGGRNDHSGACNRLFCFEPISCKWSNVRIHGDLIPSARDGHSACVINDRMYIFGGFEDITQQFSNDLYYFDFKLSSWYLQKANINDQIPERRDFHTATNINNQMYIFGGRFDPIGTVQTSDNIYDNNLYVFNTETNFWSVVTTQGQIPIGRRSHSAFAYNEKLYIFGGFNSIVDHHYNDIYEFNPVTSIWQLIKTHGIQKPIPRRRQCCIVVKHCMYMFGGTSPISAALSQTNSNNVLNINGNTSRLYDQNDLYVFAFAPSLKALCFNFLAKEKINANHLPKRFHDEYKYYLQSNLIHPQSNDKSSG